MYDNDLNMKKFLSRPKPTLAAPQQSYHVLCANPVIVLMLIQQQLHHTTIRTTTTTTTTAKRKVTHAALRTSKNKSRKIKTEKQHLDIVQVDEHKPANEPYISLCNSGIAQKSERCSLIKHFAYFTYLHSPLSNF